MSDLCAHRILVRCVGTENSDDYKPKISQDTLLGPLWEEKILSQDLSRTGSPYTRR